MFYRNAIIVAQIVLGLIPYFEKISGGTVPYIVVQRSNFSDPESGLPIGLAGCRDYTYNVLVNNEPPQKPYIDACMVYSAYAGFIWIAHLVVILATIHLFTIAFSKNSPSKLVPSSPSASSEKKLLDHENGVIVIETTSKQQVEVSETARRLANMFSKNSPSGLVPSSPSTSAEEKPPEHENGVAETEMLPKQHVKHVETMQRTPGNGLRPRVKPRLTDD